MPQPPALVTPENILASVVRITEQRSRESLEHSLVATLINLTDLSVVSIMRPVSVMGETVLERVVHAARNAQPAERSEPIPLARFPLLARAMISGRPETDIVPDGVSRSVVPFAGGESEESLAYLVLDGPTDPMRYFPLIRGFAAVYSNFLGILRDAERDTLTSLKNRKTFDENINRIIVSARTLSGMHNERRHHEQGEHHWLAICDIDHFKRINDTFGHVFGDEVLLLFSALMKKTFRTDDLLFRFGGEEFVVVLAPTTAERAGAAYERFRTAIESFAFPQVGRVTASIGYVCIQPSDIPTTVLGQADEALYFAKNNGRNKVCRYETLVASGDLASAHEEGSVELF